VEPPKLPSQLEFIGPPPPEIEIPTIPLSTDHKLFSTEHGIKEDEKKEYKQSVADFIAQQAPVPVLEPAFDPQEEATKRYENEQRKAEVDAAYKEQYGKPEEPPSLLNSAVDVAKSLRGTIGGQFGTAAGAVLDVASAAGKVASTTGAAEGGAAGLGPVAVAATAVVGAFVALNKATDEMVKKFEGYSANLSAATAQADVRSQLGDLRRAQEIGPKLAEFVTAQSKMDQSLEDIKITIMQSVVPILTDMLEVLRPLVESQGGLLSVTSNVAQFLYNNSALGILGNILKELKSRDETSTDTFDPLTDILVPNL
jgi:hypothetical protein